MDPLPPASAPAATIVAVAFSADAALCAVARASKRVRVYRVSASHSDALWAVMTEWSAVKRPSHVAFSPDATHVVVADKAGDVYLYGHPLTPLT